MSTRTVPEGADTPCPTVPELALCEWTAPGTVPNAAANPVLFAR